jgi:putative transposase
LGRAVDQEENILDIPVQRQRDKTAAKKFFRKLLKGLSAVPRVIVTDKFKSFGAAKREILPGMEHWQHRYLNTRAENSHQPAHQRKQRMPGFKSPKHAPCLLTAYGPMTSHVRPRRHRFTAQPSRQELVQCYQIWREITGRAAA